MSLLLSARKWLALLGVFSIASPSVFGQAAFDTQGGEYRLIGTLPGDQVYPQVAFNSTGGYIVWQDNVTDGDGFGISARRLDPNLSGALGVFRVNSEGAGDQRNPQVSMLANGGAVFVWEGGKSGSENIYARFLRPDGTYISTDMLVNTYTVERRSHPSVAVLSDGNVIVVWSSFGQDGSLDGVYGQRFSSNGRKLGAEFRVNQTTLYNQRTPTVAALPDGKFIVIWVSESFRGVVHATDPSGRNSDSGGGLQRYNVELFGRIFDGAGSAGNEFKLNKSDLICANPSISTHANGFTLVWSGRPNEVVVREKLEDGWDIFTRTFDNSGKPLGDDFRLNTFVFGDQFVPKISSLGSEQLVVWTSMNNDGSREGISARLLSLEGEAISREFRVNTTTVGSQVFPAVASDGDRRYLVVWSSFVGGVASFDLFGQRYSSQSGLSAPAAPYISALNQSRLSVTWPALAGYTGVEYQLYINGNSEPLVLSENSWIAQSLAPGSTHSFRLGFKLADGRTSPISAAASGRTWGEDNNFDGLPDDWQEKYWGPDRSKWPGAHVDSDGDGATNLEEFLAGTNPTDAVSVLRTEIVSNEQGTRLVWNSEPGSIYQVQVSPNLNSWENYGSARFAAGKTDSHPVETGATVAIYRVIRVR
jgi:hypothetical protein